MKVTKGALVKMKGETIIGRAPSGEKCKEESFYRKPQREDNHGWNKVRSVEM